jgi:CRP-like cAMP-binding protein
MYVSGNRLLDALPPTDRAGLGLDVEIITLAPRNSTHAVGALMRYVDFPISAVLSVVALLEDGDAVEVATVGSEGFVESDAALNSPHSQRSSFCQVGGAVGRMAIGQFEVRMAGSATFAQLMRRNVRATLFSAQQFAACNAKHAVLQRCARWLSMTEDRVGSSAFRLTHELLAIMLGVRRSSVSEAADTLQKMGAIRYRRGAITVLDRALLHATACECYGACKAAFATSLGD